MVSVHCTTATIDCRCPQNGHVGLAVLPHLMDQERLDRAGRCLRCSGRRTDRHHVLSGVPCALVSSRSPAPVPSSRGKRSRLGALPVWSPLKVAKIVHGWQSTFFVGFGDKGSSVNASLLCASRGHVLDGSGGDAQRAKLVWCTSPTTAHHMEQTARLLRTCASLPVP